MKIKYNILLYVFLLNVNFPFTLRMEDQKRFVVTLDHFNNEAKYGETRFEKYLF